MNKIDQVNLLPAGPSSPAALPSTPFDITFANFMSNLKLSRITVDETLEVIDSMDIQKSSAIDRLISLC